MPWCIANDSENPPIPARAFATEVHSSALNIGSILIESLFSRRIEKLLSLMVEQIQVASEFASNIRPKPIANMQTAFAEMLAKSRDMVDWTSQSTNRNT